MNAPNIPKMLNLTGNPAVDGLILKGILLLAAYIVHLVAPHLHITDPDYITYLTGSVVSTLIIVVTFAYGWFLTKANQAKAVQAGVNLTVSGNALAADGKTVVTANDGSTPPLPVTAATANQIVKNFAIPSKA